MNPPKQLPFTPGAYRLLRPEEKVKRGDSVVFKRGDEVWVKVGMSIGCHAGFRGNAIYRRPLK